MRTFSLLLMAAAVVARAQTTPPGPNPPIRFQPVTLELQRFLVLTEGQMLTVGQKIDTSQRFLTEGLRRSLELQRQILEETSKPAPDPMALGVRYAELETIRRANTTEEARLLEDVRSVLTEAQRTRLRTLEEAQRLQSLICDAQRASLLPGGTSLAGGIFRTGDFLPPTGITFSGRNLCGVAGLPGFVFSPLGEQAK